MKHPVYLNQLGLVCSLGAGKSEVSRSLFHPPSQLPVRLLALSSGGHFPVASVSVPLVDVGQLPKHFRSRNNALILTALQEIRQAVDDAIEHYGAARVGVVMGTSTSGMKESEEAVSHWHRRGEFLPEFDFPQMELGSAAGMISEFLQLSGPAWVVSTACSSSAKAMISAARLLRSGRCDAVIVGGSDSLCQFTVSGFSGLELLSQTPCNPMSLNRSGIHIGEGCAIFLMTRKSGGTFLAGWGESADAHHMSAPDPTGGGAILAMREALSQAGLNAGDIDYINLHGTATWQNDAMECRAVAEVLGVGVPASSTKPLTGHTLGAAGALEAAFCWLTLMNNPLGTLPVHVWDGMPDPALPALNLVREGQCLGRPPRFIMSNSFAFGGSNASLVFARAEESGLSPDEEEKS